MHRRVKTHQPLLRALHILKPKYRRILLKACQEEEINFICECIHNVLQGKIPLHPQEKSKLGKYKNILRTLLRKGRKHMTRKNIIIQKGGSFLPIILGAVLSTLVNSLL